MRGQGTWGKGGGLNSQQRGLLHRCSGFFWHPALKSWAGQWLTRRMGWVPLVTQGGSSGLQKHWIPGWLGFHRGILWVLSKVITSSTQPLQRRGFSTGSNDLPTSSSILIGCGEAVPSSGLCKSSWEASFPAESHVGTGKHALLLICEGKSSLLTCSIYLDCKRKENVTNLGTHCNYWGNIHGS